MRLEPLIYNFEYQRKANTRKSIKGRFKNGDKSKAFWAKNKDNYSDKESPKPTKNELRGLRSGVRLINKLNTIKETIDSKSYVMPIYKNGFINVESFIPRNSNRQKHRVIVPGFVSQKWGYRGKYSRYRKERDKIFNSKRSAERHAIELEQEHIEHVKQQYEDYFKTNKYT
jgi:hypothetical protein